MNRKGLAVTPSLFHESLSDALRECIGVCGGFKSVGYVLWPEKGPEGAGRFLSDCLNDAKREKLSPEQMMVIMRMARAKGCHAAIVWICRELAYADPQPLEPADERAALQRQFIHATNELRAMAERIAQLAPGLRSAA